MMLHHKSFRDFMSRALYHPETGYYMQKTHPASMAGDYITASQHPLFAACMARHLARMCAGIEHPALADVGAGSGIFLLNLIRFLEKDDPAFLDRLSFFAVEKIRRFEHPRVKILQDISELPMLEGCIFSFELFDALPCHELVSTSDGLKELFVDGEKFVEGPVSDERLPAFLDRFNVKMQNGQRAEVCLYAEPLYGIMASKLTRGSLLTFDYGARASTLYRSSLYPSGTLMCHSKHTFDREVLKDPGSRDITYAVNFTGLLEKGERLGLITQDFKSLSAFLSEAGAGLPHDLLQEKDPFPARDLLFGTIGQDLKLLSQSRLD